MSTATQSSERYHSPKSLPVPLIHQLEKKRAPDCGVLPSTSPPAKDASECCFRLNCFPKALDSSSEYLTTSSTNRAAASYTLKALLLGPSMFSPFP